MAHPNRLGDGPANNWQPDERYIPPLVFGQRLYQGKFVGVKLKRIRIIALKVCLYLKKFVLTWYCVTCAILKVHF